MRSRLRTATVAVIDGFTDWFGTVACVVETLTVCAILAAIEAAFPSIDPHNFKFLYAMTFYSSVTQPALAYAAARLMARVIELIREVRSAQAENRAWQEQTDRNHTDMLRAILVLLERHGDSRD